MTMLPHLRMLLLQLVISCHPYKRDHHLLLSVPPHKLKDLHTILRERGALQGADIAPGYGNVIRQLTTKAA